MVVWRENFARLAALPNVACKLSGLLGLAPVGQRNDAATYVPVLECAVASFGWERLMWGSDWPLCDLAGSLDAWRRITGALVSSASPTQRDALFHANATRIYRLF